MLGMNRTRFKREKQKEAEAHILLHAVNVFFLVARRLKEDVCIVMIQLGAIFLRIPISLIPVSLMAVGLFLVSAVKPWCFAECIFQNCSSNQHSGALYVEEVKSDCLVELLPGSEYASDVNVVILNKEMTIAGDGNTTTVVSTENYTHNTDLNGYGFFAITGPSSPTPTNPQSLSF